MTSGVLTEDGQTTALAVIKAKSLGSRLRGNDKRGVLTEDGQTTALAVIKAKSLGSRLRGNDKRGILTEDGQTTALAVIPANAGTQRREGLQPAAHLLASQRNGTLYLGVTINLVQRIWQHRGHLAAESGGEDRPPASGFPRSRE